jgi:hypothetical protein
MLTSQAPIRLPLPPNAIQPENLGLTCGNTVTRVRYTVRYAIQETPCLYLRYRTVLQHCDTELNRLTSLNVTFLSLYRMYRKKRKGFNSGPHD